MVTLYYSPGACSRAAHIVLEEIGRPYEKRRVDLRTGAHKQPDYLAINPRGKVPALQLDDGTVLTENPVVLTWLADSAPEKELLPSEPLARARAMTLLCFLSSEVHPCFGRLYRPTAFSTNEEHANAIREVGARDFVAALEKFQALIDPTGPFALGSKFSVVDPLADVMLSWALAFKLDVSCLGRLQALSKAVAERPAAQRAIAAEQ
jgi:glutathione S-transferase